MIAHVLPRENVQRRRPNADSSPATSVAVLLWWIGLVPALAYWRFRSTDL